MTKPWPWWPKLWREPAPDHARPVRTDHMWTWGGCSTRRCQRCYETEGNHSLMCRGRPAPIVIDTERGMP